MNSLLSKALLLVVATSLLASCASTSLIETWRNPTVSGKDSTRYWW